MKRPTLSILVVSVLLLAIGWGVFRLMNGSDLSLAVDSGFRDWLWQYRGLDLVVQVLLVFAGALGIAAILPMEDGDA